MVAKPPLPDGVDLPLPINGWVHHPESIRNGHVWTGTDADRSVAVFSHFGTTVSVAVFDDRVDGFANRIEPARRDIRDDESQPEAVVWGVDRAVAWMDWHAPTEWDHHHRQENADGAVGMAGGGSLDSEASLETRAYLVVKARHGSDNATVALARGSGPTTRRFSSLKDPASSVSYSLFLESSSSYWSSGVGSVKGFGDQSTIIN